MMLIWNYIRITLYPVAPILVCGFIVWACMRLFVRLLGRDSYRILVAASLIGTPVHELGHAMMCPLFGHKIVEMVLWQHGRGDGCQGYVRHTSNPDVLYQRLGGLFISTGPIFSGMAVMSLMLFLAFPDTWSAHISTVSALVGDGASVTQILFSGLDLVRGMIAEFGSASSPVWMRLTAVLIMLSVSLQISLSPQDLENAIRALPPYLMVTLAVTVIVSLLGKTVTGAVVGALEMFSTFLMAMFMLVMAFAAIQIAAALVLRWILALIRG